MTIKKIIMLIIIGIAVITIGLLQHQQEHNIPLIAIANYGPHSSLSEAIQGIKDELAHHGFIENQTIRYEVVDVGFDASLIPQMITHLKSHHPDVMMAATTPVAQYAKGAIHDIPLIYTVITDPVAAGLIKTAYQPDMNITGSSDRQDLKLLLNFAKRLIPTAKKVGILYATAEVNDHALVRMMKQAARASGLKVLAIPVDSTRDVPLAMQRFKNAVDFIYVGSSGPVQSAFPVIVSEGNRMGIPIFNMNEDPVKKGLALASFGVNYYQVGVNAGKLVVNALQGTPLSQLKPIYPQLNGYHGFINRKNALKFKIALPENLQNIQVVG